MAEPEPGWVSEKLVEGKTDRDVLATGTSARSNRQDVAPKKRRGGSINGTLCFFRVITIVTVLLALTVAATNIYIIYKDYDSLGARGILLRVYGTIFCVAIIFTELENVGFLKWFAFLNFWVARGITYGFVGLICWDQEGTQNDTTSYEAIIAFMMMGVGIIYILLGLACMKTVKEAEQHRAEEDDSAA